MKPTKVRKHRPYQQLPESFSRMGLDEQSIQQATGMHAAQEEYFSRSKKMRVAVLRLMQIYTFWGE